MRSHVPKAVAQGVPSAWPARTALRIAAASSGVSACDWLRRFRSTRRAPRQLVVADDERERQRRSLSARRMWLLRLLRPGSTSSRSPRRRKLAGKMERARLRALAERSDEQVEPRRHFRAGQRQHEPLDAEREADAGHRGAVEARHQAVVAPAAADRVLRAEALGDDLERRAAIVVEAANHSRVDRVRDRLAVEARAHGGEVRGTGGAQWSIITGASRVCLRILLAVEDAQRIALEPAVAIAHTAIAARLRPATELVAIAWTARGVAERVQLEPRRGEAEGREVVGQHHQQLGVHQRIIATEHLGADLVELPEATLLRALATKHRPRVEQLRNRLAPVASRARCRRAPPTPCPRGEA